MTSAGRDKNNEIDHPSHQVNGAGTKPATHDGSVVDLTIRSTELDEMEDLTNSLISSHRLRPLTKDGAFDSTLQIHGLPDFCNFSISYGRPVAGFLQDESSDDRLAFVMAPEGHGQLDMNRQELDISGHHGVVFPAGPPRTINHSGDCQLSVLIMNRRKAADYCAKLLGRDLDQDLQFDLGFDLTSAHGQSWVRLFQYATAELANPHSLFRSIAAARQQLEQTVLTGFLLSQTHTYSDALLRPQSAAVPFYVKRAEAYIEAHFSETLSLAEIAAQAGVSARSLQNGFQAYRNTTPMAFLRSFRLQRVHRALLVADPATARVIDIALACGFNHMGEFAAAYRNAFGVSPSQTLLRKARAS